MRFILVGVNSYVVFLQDPFLGYEIVLGIFSIDDAKQNYFRGCPEGSKK